MLNRKYILYTLGFLWLLGFLTIGGRLGEPLLKFFLELIYGVKVECEYFGRAIDYCYSLGSDIPGVAYLPQILFFIIIGVPVVGLFIILGLGEYRLKKKK